MKVKTFCKCCIEKFKDYEDKEGVAYMYPINDETQIYLVTIVFNECHHKRVGIKTLTQIKAMEIKEV